MKTDRLEKIIRMRKKEHREDKMRIYARGNALGIGVREIWVLCGCGDDDSEKRGR
jgi:hypothetical protein